MAIWKALVVDDSPTLRQALVAMLERIPDLQCVEAGDGAEGLQKLLADRVDLVVTDLQMPVMNGFALIHFLRNRADLRDLPIVVVTSAGTEADRTKLEMAGVRAFLRKPILADQLTALALSLLEPRPAPIPARPPAKGIS